MVKSRNRKPPSVIQERLDRCRAEMKRREVIAYLITNRMDQIYLTGFDGEDGAALVTPRDVHLISDGRFDEAMDIQAPWAKKYLRPAQLVDGLSTYFKKIRPRRVAFQADQVSVQMLSAMRRACKPTGFEKAPPIVNHMRLVKDKDELDKIRHAIRIAQEAFEATRRQIKVGMTETHLAAILEYEMKRRGASAPSYRTIVAEGANASIPHAEPGTRVIKNGSLILIDWGALSDYYCSDLTRVLFMGKIPPPFKKVYQIVLEAQRRGIAAISPGKRVCDIDKVARDYIRRAGYGKYFDHGLGHGLGLDIHEEPRLKTHFTDRLQPGMVVTVEPGIYLPSRGGVRIEDDVLVTHRGHQVLTSLNKELDSAVL